MFVINRRKLETERYKTFGPRVAAFLIDGLIYWSLLYFESYFLLPGAPEIAVAGLLISYFSCHFYGVYLHAVYGQTLGKMAAGVVVLNSDLSPIGWRQAFLREMPYMILSAAYLGAELCEIALTGITDDFRGANVYDALLVINLLWLFAEAAVMLGSGRRRAIHDFLAGTVVSRTRCWRREGKINGRFS